MSNKKIVLKLRIRYENCLMVPLSKKQYKIIFKTLKFLHAKHPHKRKLKGGSHA
jgi:hypothetical protein